MIIDTPLAKLDTKHVANITSKFFPNASEQVILLSQDREIDQNIYSLIKPHLNQSYTLMQTEENKIKSGYFFK
jgi:DNA sulfur modification protein DndD